MAAASRNKSQDRSPGGCQLRRPENGQACAMRRRRIAKSYQPRMNRSATGHYRRRQCHHGIRRQRSGRRQHRQRCCRRLRQHHRPGQQRDRQDKNHSQASSCHSRRAMRPIGTQETHLCTLPVHVLREISCEVLVSLFGDIYRFRENSTRNVESVWQYGPGDEQRIYTRLCSPVNALTTNSPLKLRVDEAVKAA